MSKYVANKPAKYYICCDSNKQKEDSQNMMKNIESKTRKSYGQNLLDALTYYNEFLKALKETCKACDGTGWAVRGKQGCEVCYGSGRVPA